MGYVKNAMMEVQSAGCLWIEDAVLERLRDAGHSPKTRRVVVEGFNCPVEIDALPFDEGFRLLGLAGPEDREAILDALAEMGPES